MSDNYEQLSLDLNDKPLQPWQMSRSQFEKSRGVVWRAETSERLGDHYDPMRSGGIHFGSYESAMQRGQQVAGGRRSAIYPRVPEGQKTRLFSALPVGRFSNTPETAGKDIVYDRGVWPQRKTGYWYRNKIEGAGSISGYVPRRDKFLKTHKEFVTDAINQGKDVHPNIAWEAEHSPDWSDTPEPTPEWKPTTQEDLDQTLFPHTIGNKMLTQDEFDEMRMAIKNRRS